MAKIWMMLSRDEYALPVLCADSAKEMAELTGAKEVTIRTIASRNRLGRFKNGKYVCVDVGEDETAEEVERLLARARR